MEPTTQGEINLRDYLTIQQAKKKIIYMSLSPFGAKAISRKAENIAYVEGHGIKAPFGEIRESFYDYLVPLYDRRAIRQAEEEEKN